MTEESRDLYLSGDGVSGIRLRGDDARAVESLRQFAKLVNLSLQKSSGHADAHLCSEEPAPELAERFHLHQDRRTLSYFRGYQHDFYLHANDDGSHRYVIAKLQKLLLYGYAASLIHGGDFDLIHGALLETAPGIGTLLFGDSGIGKSTTVRRWHAAGNVAIADDMVYLYRKGEGFYARPLPTWSACLAGENPENYDFNREVRVERALLLLRDKETEHIGEIPEVHYRLGAVKAVSETASWLLPYLPDDWREALASRLMAFAGSVIKKFPPRALFAHLAGNIVETMAE
ncbi:MAG: hypothetical protein MJ033_03760 [Victivallaceae bacterium]|nr:hypothetical protein [Victivallaceae bacterium]